MTDSGASAGAVVVAIHLYPAPQSGGPAVPVERASAIPGRGLQGDRHERRPRARRQVLVVEQEVLDEFGLAPGAVREQVTVRGLGLDALAEGTRLRIGGVQFTVDGPCAPCERMDEIQPGLRAAIGDRRGRFLKVAGAGEFAVGDRIVAEPAEASAAASRSAAAPGAPPSSS